MPPEFLIALLALVIFGSLFHTVRLIVDARTRNRIIASSRSDELIRSYLALEADARRLASLRAGIVLAGVSAACALIELMGWQISTDRLALAPIAVLIGAVAAGNLLHHAIVSRSRKET